MIVSIPPTAGLPPKIGLYFAQMEDVRRETKKYIAGLTPEQLSWYPNGRVESVGTLLLHIAAVELSWIGEDIMGNRMGEEWIIGFPIRFNIPQIQGKPLSYFIEKLDSVREESRRSLESLSDPDLARAVTPLDDVGTSGARQFTIEWILYHLIEHEAHHRGQIAQLKRLFPADLQSTS